MLRSILKLLLFLALGSGCATSSANSETNRSPSSKPSFPTRRFVGFDWKLQTESSSGEDIQCNTIPTCKGPANCDFSNNRALGRDLDTLSDRCPERAKNFVNHGGQIVCYFGFGVTHTRDLEKEKPTDYVLKYRRAKVQTCGALPGWPDNLLLQLKDEENRINVMQAHREIVDSARELCTALEPDVMDGYQYDTVVLNNTEVPANCGNIEDIKKVALEMCNYAHLSGQYSVLNNKGLKPIGCFQKNAHAMVPALANIFDGAIVEACLAYEGDCAHFEPYSRLGKAVIDREYASAGGTNDDSGIINRKQFLEACRINARILKGFSDIGLERSKLVFGDIVSRCPPF